MLGSDYPHDERTWPFTRELSVNCFTTPTRTSYNNFSQGNAARLYDFSLEDLAPLAAEFGPIVAELHQPLAALPDDANEALLKSVPRA
jgi:hypothetical protein